MVGGGFPVHFAFTEEPEKKNLFDEQVYQHGLLGNNISVT